MEVESRISNNNLVPPHKSVIHWLVVAVAIVVVIGYFMASYAFNLWPFEGVNKIGNVKQVLPQSDLLIKTVDISTWKTHQVFEYGFELSIPTDYTFKEWAIDNSGKSVPGRYELSTNKSFNSLYVLSYWGDDIVTAAYQEIKMTCDQIQDSFTSICREIKEKNEIITRKGLRGFEFKVAVNESHMRGDGTWDTREVLWIFFVFDISSSEEKLALLISPSEETPREAVREIVYNTLGLISLKTYRNEEYGFEFKYPGDWLATRSYEGYDYEVFRDHFYYTSSGKYVDLFSLAIYETIEDLDVYDFGVNNLSEYVKEYSKYSDTGRQSTDRMANPQPISIGGRDGYRAYSEPYFTEDNLYYFVENGYVVEFDTYRQASQEMPTILDSFKFTK